MRFSRSVMISTPSSVHAPPMRMRSVSTSPSSVHAEYHGKHRRQRRQRRHARYRITLHEMEISGVRDEARADGRERERAPRLP